jgi:hypothetical protein
MKTCPDCGERVYNLGCVNCNEADYIEEQIVLDAIRDSEEHERGDWPIAPAPALRETDR